MGDIVDFQASPETPSTESAAMPPKTPRRSVFRDVPWRWSDLLLGFAPFLFSHTWSSSARDHRSPRYYSNCGCRCSCSLRSGWSSSPYGSPAPGTFIRLASPASARLGRSTLRLARRPRRVRGLHRRAPARGSSDRRDGVDDLPLGSAGRLLQSNGVADLRRGGGSPSGPLPRSCIGFFFNALRQKIHPIPAALIQAAVFGYAHPFGLGNSVAIGVVALIFALVYQWRKTLLTPILLHSGVNAVGMILLAANVAADAAGATDRRLWRAEPGWLPGHGGGARQPGRSGGASSRGRDHDGKRRTRR